MASDDSPDTPVGGKGAKEDLIKAFNGDIRVDGSRLERSTDVYDGPYGVVDPRLIGYTYLSYVFIESGGNLQSGFQADETLFDETEKALMIGAALGEYDFIHRRADVSQYRHADFAVDAIDAEDDELSFVRNIETYPLFTIGRWHGQDVPVKNMTLRREVESSPQDRINDLEAEFLYEMIHNPEVTPNQWLKNIRTRISNDLALVSESELDERLEDYGDVKNWTNGLNSKYILGESIAINPANIRDYHHLVVGISVKEGVEIDDGEAYDLPNEKVIDRIRQKDVFDGWTMPYIVSGVGKSWGDILVEIHTNDIDDMEGYAEEIRDVDGVRSTKTFAMTGTSFHKPLVITSPGDIQTRGV